MKRTVSLLFLIIMIIFTQTTVLAYDTPEAYMGFSVTDDWYVFSKDMSDEEVLDALNLTKEEVNEILENSDCKYIIKNKNTESEIYVKTERNELSYEYYNISKTDNAHILENLSNLLSDAFLMEGLNYNPDEVEITDYAQMKFITVLGSTFYDNKEHAIVFGGTIVNGTAIGFTMFLDKKTAEAEDIALLREIASTVSFTVIKDKADDSLKAEKQENIPETFDFIAGGFGAIVIIVFCIYMIEKLRHKENDDEPDDETEEKTDEKEE